jgi:protein-arginine kinase activator protein McsA
MFLKTKRQRTTHSRTSKLGLTHTYERIKTIAEFRCDNCDTEFERDIRNVNRKRLSNNYFHVCENCDSKRFAQRKGVEQKKIWDLPASTTLPVGKY